jgi:CBS domain-containing protein
MRKMSDIVRDQDPVTLPPSATVRDACRCMRERRVGAVLVTEDDHRLLGIFSGRDAVRRVLAEGKSAARTKLAEVMTWDPDTMPPGNTAIEALRLMEDGRYRHVPVVDGGKVVGIVSRFDFSGIELDRRRHSQPRARESTRPSVWRRRSGSARSASTITISIR